VKRITYAVMSTITALVLLFGYRTSTSSKATSNATVAIGGSAPTSTSTAPSSTSSDPAATGTTAPSSAAAASPLTSSNAAASSAAKTVTGTAADTRYGPVQVQVTVKNKKVTNVSVIEYPNNDGRDQEINANALPTLISETLSAQSANIDMVSGATYTSQGYLASLQSALDQAGV
jgi:uncharacterized protein with FMN-binding domain